MKLTKDLVANVLAFTVGSVVAEFMIQRQERKVAPAPAPRPQSPLQDAYGVPDKAPAHE